MLLAGVVVVGRRARCGRRRGTRSWSSWWRELRGALVPSSAATVVVVVGASVVVVTGGASVVVRVLRRRADPDGRRQDHERYSGEGDEGPRPLRGERHTRCMKPAYGPLTGAERGPVAASAETAPPRHAGWRRRPGRGPHYRLRWGTDVD